MLTRISRALRPLNTVKVAIVVNDAYTNNFSTLYRELEADDRFSVFVLATDRLGTDFSHSISAAEISQLLTQDTIAHSVDPNAFHEFAPHYVFTTNPYDIYIAEPFRSAQLARFSKLVNVSYGAVLIPWTGKYQFLQDNPYLQHMFRSFTESKLIHQDDHRFVPVGYLKLDEYLHYGRKPAIFPKFSIAWKPRWTHDSDSSLRQHLHFFLEFAQTQDVILNFIMHPMLLSSLPDDEESRNMRATIEALQALPNVTIVGGKDFLDDVLGSDVYVGDISSTLAEFSSTGKPIVYTDTGIELNELGSEIISASYVVSNQDALRMALTRLMNEDDPKRHCRRGLFERVFEHDPQTSVARQIVEYLWDHRYDRSIGYPTSRFSKFFRPFSSRASVTLARE